MRAYSVPQHLKQIIRLVTAHYLNELIFYRLHNKHTGLCGRRAPSRQAVLMLLWPRQFPDLVWKGEKNVWSWLMCTCLNWGNKSEATLGAVVGSGEEMCVAPGLEAPSGGYSSEDAPLTARRLGWLPSQSNSHKENRSWTEGLTFLTVEVVYKLRCTTLKTS